MIVRLDNRINASVVRAGFRFDIESEQTEYRVEDGLECRFAFFVDRVGYTCKKCFENFSRLFQIAFQKSGCQIRGETADFAPGFADVAVQQICAERFSDFLIREVKPEPAFVEPDFTGFNGEVSRLQQQGYGVDVVNFERIECYTGDCF